jgi:ubiquitin C-terminal hydrolase
MKVLQTAPNPNQPGQLSGPQKIELDTCISNFARPETLEGSNKWHCEKCN